MDLSQIMGKDVLLGLTVSWGPGPGYYLCMGA